MLAPGARGSGKRAVLLLVFTLSGASGLDLRGALDAAADAHLRVDDARGLDGAGGVHGRTGGGQRPARRAGRTATADRALRAYGLLEIAIGVLGFAVPLLLAAVEARLPAPGAAARDRADGSSSSCSSCSSASCSSCRASSWAARCRSSRAGSWGARTRSAARVGALYAANTLGACARSGRRDLRPAAARRRARRASSWPSAMNSPPALVALALARRAAAGAAGTERRAGRRRERPARAAPPGGAAAARRDRALGLRGHGRRGGLGAPGRPRLRQLRLRVRPDAPALPRRDRDRQRDLLADARAPTRRAFSGSRSSRNTFAALLGIALVPQLPSAYMRGFPAVQDSFASSRLLQILETAPLLLPIAILFGIAFPAAVAATRDLRGMGRGVGRVTAWNTVGTVAGAFLGGFVLVPRIGLRASLTSPRRRPRSAACSRSRRAAAPRLAAHRAGGGRRRARRRAAACRPGRSDLLAQGAGFYAAIYGTVRGPARRGAASELLFYKDGIATTLSVDRQGPYRFYRSNGKTDASTDPGDMANQLLLGHLPMLLHPDPRTSSCSASAPASPRRPSRATPCGRSRSPTSRRAAREATQLFAAENRNVLADPRVRFLVADGRNALLARAEDLRRDHLRSVGRLGRRRRQPLHARSSTRSRARACGRAA